MSLLTNLDKISPKRIFLIDACGAVVSAVMLGIVLTKLESMIGMPSSTLYLLSVIACFLAVYSFFCFSRMPKSWKLYLKAIAIANLMYGVLTMTLVFYLYQSLTFLGLIYFFLELLVIVVLAYVELKIAQTSVQ